MKPILIVGPIGLVVFAVTAPLRLAITAISLCMACVSGPSIGWSLNIAVGLQART